MVNKVTLIGNLGQDPELRVLESGVPVAKFSVATSEKYKDKNGESQSITEWHNVVVWRGLAELAQQYLKKGRQVYIEGKLTHRKWEDKEGITRYTTEIVARNFRMLGSKDGSGYKSNFPSESDAPVVVPKNDSTPPSSPPPAAPQPVATAEDDMPF